MRDNACSVILIDPGSGRHARLAMLAKAVGTSGCAEALGIGRPRNGVDLVVVAGEGEEIAAGVAAARHACRGARILVFGADRSQEAAIAALRAGADDFSPADDVELAGRIAHHLARARAAKAIERATEDDDGLVGTSLAMRKIRAFITKVAATEATVLVTGETGTGKELVARMIHRRGRRAAGPLVAVNCAAIPETLIEAELFGHARGAFTGADRSYPGKLGLANGGTLMLDEIGELSQAGQAKVLRALERREVWPVGGRAAVCFDARVVAATNRDLEAEAAAGSFRRDLFYRLAVARVHVPPLRDRPEDIAPTARHLLTELDPAGRTRFDNSALDRLAAHAWPGNVRELRNAIEVALMNVAGDRISGDDLPRWGGSASRPAPVQGSSEGERRALVAALSQAGGNKSRAAEALACSRMTLYRRMVRHGLAAPA